MLLSNLRRQNRREVELLQKSIQGQLRKSIDVQKMPSVRVRPTLRVEMKHRVMNCKVRDKSPTKELNIDQLNESVLKSLRKSRRSKLGGPAK